MKFHPKKTSLSTPPPSNGIHIEKTIPEAIFCPPKGTLCKSIINPNAHVAQYYNIVEYLAQASFTTLDLEVLQTFPTQWKNLLTTLGAMDPENSNIITFKLDDFKMRLSHQLAFQIATKIARKTIHRTVLDEGASTSVMSLSCWRSIGSAKINRSPTTLNAFDGRSFQPYGLLPTIHVELGRKSVSIQIEVFDAPLDYNLILGRNLFYAMEVVASTIFRIV